MGWLVLDFGYTDRDKPIVVLNFEANIQYDEDDNDNDD